jgi:hypothetical protein
MHTDFTLVGWGEFNSPKRLKGVPRQFPAKFNLTTFALNKKINKAWKSQKRMSQFRQRKSGIRIG